ncbi:MAG TPA: patatin-like phospholipase family protein [Casimicrobiaceae bacterium]|nr:patatin-like phospholipase family protein [Casimicrobiaceae bacterium]
MKRRARRSRIGLALAGGGPLGGIYEVGALIAIADSLAGLDVNELDVYVGVSSGALVTGALANRISPAQIHRLFIDDGADALALQSIFLRPAVGEISRRLLQLPALTLSAVWKAIKDPLHAGVGESLATIAKAMPVGMFDNRKLDRLLRTLFEAPGRSNDFRTLGRKLFLVATHLDSAAPVVFGGRGSDHVPVSRAIVASSALPGLFPPVEIDGEHYVDGALNKTLHASVALREGVDLLLCINPLVPYDARVTAHGRGRRAAIDKLHRGGLPLVLSQTFRAIMHSRMRGSMERYRAQFPRADVVLFEPEREDARMFFANVFGYRHRKRICAFAYTRTRRNLLARANELGPLLERHGISLQLDRLINAHRRVTDATRDPRPLAVGPVSRRSVRFVARNLQRMLDELERHLRDQSRSTLSSRSAT